MNICVTRQSRFDIEHPKNFTGKRMTYSNVLRMIKKCQNPLDDFDRARLHEKKEGDYFFSDEQFEYKINVRY